MRSTSEAEREAIASLGRIGRRDFGIRFQKSGKLGTMTTRGRPRTPVRMAAETAQTLGGSEETMRTSMDRIKATVVLATLLPAGFSNTPADWAAFRARWPKFFRGGRMRITVLRPFYPVAQSKGFAEALAEFHNDPDWRTARQGEEFAKTIVAIARGGSRREPSSRAN